MASGADPAETPPPSRKDLRGAAQPVEATPEAGVAFQSHVRAARTEFENQVAHARADFEEVNERIKQRTGRDLIVATLIGVAIGALLVLSLVFFKVGFVA